MTQLWTASSPLTVRDVHDGLERELAYTTVMTVLGRLAKKGLVRQERDGKAYRYAAASTREQMAASLMVDALGDVGEDPTAALVAFVDRVGPEGAAALRAALDGTTADDTTPRNGAHGGSALERAFRDGDAGDEAALDRPTLDVPPGVPAPDVPAPDRTGRDGGDLPVAPAPRTPADAEEPGGPGPGTG
jgi:predicted transcriptional regulator